MSLSITGLSYAHGGGCGHIVVDYEDGGVPKSMHVGHEDSVLETLKSVASHYGFTDKEEEFLLVAWLALMNKKRGFTKANCLLKDLDPS